MKIKLKKKSGGVKPPEKESPFYYDKDGERHYIDTHKVVVNYAGVWFRVSIRVDHPKDAIILEWGEAKGRLGDIALIPFGLHSMILKTKGNMK